MSFTKFGGYLGRGLEIKLDVLDKNKGRAPQRGLLEKSECGRSSVEAEATVLGEYDN